jgi:hypothetical protein
MIDEILIKDFKAHRETRVPLGRFTMLVGDNASGKTSVLDALALQAALNPNPVEILRGDRSLEDLLRRGATGPIELISSSGREGESWKTAIRMSLLPNDDTVPWRLELKGSLGDSAFTAGAAMNSDGGGNNPGGWNQLGRTVGTPESIGCAPTTSLLLRIAMPGCRSSRRMAATRRWFWRT